VSTRSDPASQDMDKETPRAAGYCTANEKAAVNTKHTGRWAIEVKGCKGGGRRGAQETREKRKERRGGKKEKEKKQEKVKSSPRLWET